MTNTDRKRLEALERSTARREIDADLVEIAGEHPKAGGPSDRKSREFAGVNPDLPAPGRIPPSSLEDCGGTWPYPPGSVDDAEFGPRHSQGER